MRITIRATGNVDAATAWERYERPALWPGWSPHLRSVTVDGPGDGPPADPRLAAGLTGRVHGPPGVWAAFTVLTVDAPAMRWSWRVTRGPLAVTLDHEVVTRAGGSSTSLTLRGPAPVITGYVPVAWYALHRLVTLEPDPA